MTNLPQTEILEVVIQFSKKEVILFGWETAKANVLFFLLLFLVLFAVNFVPALLSGMFNRDFPIISIVISIASYVVQIITSVGAVKIALKFVDGQKPALSDLFTYYRYGFKYFLSALLYGLIVGLGSLALIIPGIILAIRLQFCIYFVVDKDAGPIAALKHSWAITRGSARNLFLYWLVLIGVVLLGLLALVIGLLWAVPTVMVAGAYVFRKLASQTAAS